MKEKLPIPGANVSIAKRQTVGNGFRRNFQLEVKRGDVLSFHYLGVKKSITITNQKTLNVVMVENESQLDEVVVVGYGSRKRVTSLELYLRLRPKK
jgi:Zn-dependent alcohol dehydrogenase